MEIKDFIRLVRFDEFGQFISKVDSNGKESILLDVRGWGDIQNIFKDINDINNEKAEEFQTSLCKWIAGAINDKIEKESY